MLGASIKPQMLNTSVVKEDLHYIHQLGELGEYKDLMSSCYQFWKDTIQQLKFTGASKDIVSLILRLKVIQEEIGMIANLSKLHDCVSQGKVANFAS